MEDWASCLFLFQEREGVLYWRPPLLLFRQFLLCRPFVNTEAWPLIDSSTLLSSSYNKIWLNSTNTHHWFFPWKKQNTLLKAESRPLLTKCTLFLFRKQAKCMQCLSKQKKWEEVQKQKFHSIVVWMGDFFCGYYRL